MEPTEIQSRFQQLMQEQRTGSLAVLSKQGWPYLAMTPFSIDSQSGRFIIHISTLAAHTRYLLQRPQAAFMVCANETPDAPVHALPRVSFQAQAQQMEPGTPEWEHARACYFSRFPEREFMAEFTDFHLFALNIVRTRQISGFGAAKTLSPEDIKQWMRALPAGGLAK